MAQIHLGIDVDTTDVNQADAAFDRFEATVTDTATALEGVSGASQKADRGLKTVSDATSAAEARMTAAARAVAELQQQLKMEQTFWIGGTAAVRDRSTETEAYGAELDALRAKFSPLFAASKQYEAELEAIARAEKLGAISAMEAAAARERAAKSLSPVAPRAMAEAVGGLTRSFNGMKAGVQNAAFQLQDVVVQMQMGTSASKALAMQLPQLLGGFGAVGAVLGLLAGVTLPLLASMFADTGDDAGTLEDHLKAAGDAMKALDAAIANQNASLDDLREKYAGTTAEIKNMIKAQAQVAKNEAISTVNGLVRAFGSLGNQVHSVMAVTDALTGATTTLTDDLSIGARAISDQFGLASDAANALSVAFARVDDPGTLTEKAGTLSDIRQIMDQMTGSVSDNSGKWEDLYAQIVAAEERARAVAARVEDVTANTYGAVESANALAVSWSTVAERAQQASASAAASLASTRAAWAAGTSDPSKISIPGTGTLTNGGLTTVDPNSYPVFGTKAGAESFPVYFKEAADQASRLGSNIKSSGGAAKSTTDELARAKDVLAEQLREHDRLRAQVNGEKVETGYVAEERQKLLDALDKSGLSLDAFLATQKSLTGAAHMTREEYDRMLKDNEENTKHLQYQEQAAQGMVDALRGLAFGTLDVGEGVGGIMDSLTKGTFGEALDNQLNEAMKGLGDEFSAVMKDVFSGSGLSDFGVGAIGAGIGVAATGVLQGNTQQIGSGLGSAIGGALGDVAGPAITEAIGGSLGSALGAAAGPLGMVAGGLIGGFVSKLFGSKSTWKDADVTAFAGTTYSSDVTTRFNTANDGASPVARAAMIGTMNLLADFNSELSEYVDALGGTLKKGTKLVVNEQEALLAITGYANDFDAPRDGRSEQAAAEIAAKVAEIMGLAASIAKKAGPELTNAQQLWRQTQEKFSEENKAILKSLGFTAKEMYAAQMDIRRDLAQGFNKEQLDALVDTGRATTDELARWRDAELDSLKERRDAAIATAREIGADEALVRSSFRAQRKDIVAEWRDMLSEINGATAAVGNPHQMNRSAISTLVESGDATKWQIDLWKKQELASIEERRLASVKAAKEAGASVALVNQVFAGEKDRLVARWKDLIAGLAGETATAVERVTRGDRLSFAGGALDEMVQSGNTGLLAQWRWTQKQLLGIERAEKIAEAKRLGVDTTLIARLYNKKIADIEREYAQKRYQSVVDAATAALERLNTRLNSLESQRSEVLQELTRRAEEARRAEQALADARANLAAGDLNPGGPMDRYRALQSQFGAAISAARGGDSDAASQAASLAQSLLQAGRGVYASGTGYADLFKSVNQQLAGVQTVFDRAADKIEQSIDSVKIVEATEKSTRALLTALGKLNSSIERVERGVERQTRQQALAQQRQSVGTK